MKHDIAFLHTSDVHIPTFQQLVDEIKPGLRVRHDVDDQLLSDAMSAGMSPELEGRIQAAMHTASDSGTNVVVCTCSSIGGAAEQTALASPTVSMRIDRAMADAAVSHHERILVVAAVESTLAPTQQLVQQSCERLGKSPEISLQFIEGAWQHFEAGDVDAYYEAIAHYLQSMPEHYSCVLLAQASMAPVATRFEKQWSEKGMTVMASPRLGVIAALDQI